MTIEDFLRTILENPTESAPRKVAADYLEERGECDRAEFIRCQCELVRLSYKDQICRNCRVRCGDNRSKYCNFGSDPDGKNSHAWEEPLRNTLRRREAELLTATTPEPCPQCRGSGKWQQITAESKARLASVRIADFERGRQYPRSSVIETEVVDCSECKGKGGWRRSNAVRWAGKLGGLDPFLWVDQNNALGWHVGWNWAGGENGPRVDARFINGFIGCVSLSCQALMGERCPHETILLADHHFCLLCHGSGYVGGCAADLARFPLTSVELSDKRPTTGLAAEIWFEEVGYVPEDVSYSLPTPLFEALDGFTFEAIRTTNSPSRQKFYASAASAQAALSRAACQHVRSLRKELVTA